MINEEINDVLEKIKAEIEQTLLDDGVMQEYTVEEVLRIIDKYKGGGRMTNELLKLKALVECLKRDSKCECCINDECEHCDLLKEQGTLKERIEALYKVVKALDEIDLLTDTEQRIFLSAMSREREVCRMVDDTCCDNDSKVSLVKVCDSIERKVKKIWE